ncbi:Matrixin [Necator americanus]|uniref:Matrixin n=1 Tax=Necator americanus TaxID=51031 RepID=W2T059_NECAM|nr:Matrixin [Necator americanus]ETN74347.1 Matrixin [Necator americanus]
MTLVDSRETNCRVGQGCHSFERFRIGERSGRGTDRRIGCRDCGGYTSTAMLSARYPQADRSIQAIWLVLAATLLLFSVVVLKLGSQPQLLALSGTSKWDKKHFIGLHELSLKWFVSEYTNDIPKAIIRSTIQKAFQLWAKQANERNLPKVTFHFEEAASQEEADINILWATGAHGDQHEFDGASAHENILAHAFFPGHPEPLNGDIHFDDAETWETDLTAAIN